MNGLKRASAGVVLGLLLGLMCSVAFGAYSVSQNQPGAAAPGWDAVAVSPSDSTNYTAGLARALYVGGAGDVVVLTAAGTTVKFSSVPAGTILPIIHKRVNSSSTNASLMVAIF